jgi:hypothetical protein
MFLELSQIWFFLKNYLALTEGKDPPIVGDYEA